MLDHESEIIFQIRKLKKSFLMTATGDRDQPVVMKLDANTNLQNLLEFATNSDFSRKFSRIVFQFLDGNVPKMNHRMPDLSDVEGIQAVEVKATPDEGRYVFEVPNAPDAVLHADIEREFLNMHLESDLHLFYQIVIALSLLRNPKKNAVNVEFFSDNSSMPLA